MVKDGFAGQSNVHLVDILFQFMNGQFRAEEGGEGEFTAEVGIEIKATMSQGGQLAGKVLGALDAGVPIGHWQDENIGHGAGRRQWIGKRKGREVPTALPLGGFGLRPQRKVEPLEIEGAEPFFKRMVFDRNAFIVGEPGLAR